MSNSISLQNRPTPGLQIFFFKTSWSGMSRLIEQRIINVLSRLKRIDSLRIIDIEVNPDLSEHFGIYQVPSLLFIYGEYVYGRMDNEMNEKEISQKLKVIEDQIQQIQGHKQSQTED